MPEFGLAFDPSSREIIYRTSDLSFPNKQIQEVRDSHLLKEGKGSTPVLFAPEWRHPRLKAGMVFAARTGFRPQPALFVTPLLHAISVDGITWQRNRVEPTQSYPKYHPNQQPYRLEGCRNVTIDGKAY